MSAHSLQICAANGLFRAMASAHKRHIAAHSMQHDGHALVLSLPTMCEKQLPHSVAQRLQASMQFWVF
jgi:hypothetical protein